MPPATSPPGIRRTKKPSAKEQETSMAIKMLIGVVGTCLFAVLLTLWPESSSSSSFTDGGSGGGTVSGSTNYALEAFFKAKGVVFNGASVLCSGAGKCRLVATRPMKGGDTLIKIPQSALIDPRSINETAAGKACFADDFATLKEFGEKSHLGASFVNLFQYAFYFALEKRDTNGDLYGWLQALPQSVSDLPSGLTWDESMDECVEPHVSNEAKSLRGILAAAVEASAQLCDVPANKEVCGGNPPTEAELRWALSVYLHYNFQDQAVLVGANFAATSSARPGIQPTFSKEEGVLNMVAGDKLKKGEPIVINFARGPGTLLVSQGFFDSSAAGVDSRIRMPEAGSKDPLLKKHCGEKQHEMMFGRGGRPREALVNCIGLMVASEDQKKSFKTAIKKDKELKMYTYGNLTGLLQSSQKQLAEAINTAAVSPHCAKESSRLAAHMANYREFSSKVLEKNIDHCAKTYYSFNPPAPPQGGGGEVGDEDEVVTGGSATFSADGSDEEPSVDAPETP